MVLTEAVLEAEVIIEVVVITVEVEVEVETVVDAEATLVVTEVIVEIVIAVKVVMEIVTVKKKTEVLLILLWRRKYIFGITYNKKESLTRDVRTVFVSSIQVKVDEKWLRKYFEQAGTVTIMFNKVIFR